MARAGVGWQTRPPITGSVLDLVDMLPGWALADNIGVVRAIESYLARRTSGGFTTPAIPAPQTISQQARALQAIECGIAVLPVICTTGGVIALNQ